MKVATGVGILLFLGVIGLPDRVSAQEPPTPVPVTAPRTSEELKKLSDSALADARSGRLEQAISTWLDILDEVADGGRADVHANLAVAYKMAKNLPAAWHHLTAYLRAAVREDKAAAKELKALEKSLGTGHGKVGITCQPDGSRVFLEFARGAADPSGKPSGKGTAYACPLTWWFPAGEHEILVVKEGFEPLVLKVTANVRGGTGSFAAVLEGIPAYGRLEVEGSGKAIQVFLNGALEGRVPFGRRLKAGTYELMVGRPGELPWKKTITIEADKTLVERPPSAQPEAAKPDPVGPDGTQPGPGISKPAGAGDRPFPTAQTVLMAGGAAALLAGGIVQYLAYDKNQGLLDKYPPDEMDYQKWLANKDGYKQGFSDSVKPLAYTAYALYGIGGAAVAAGAVWLIVGSGGGEKKDGGTGVTVAPLVAPAGAGLSIGIGW